jgi:hypothetical protein
MKRAGPHAWRCLWSIVLHARAAVSDLSTRPLGRHGLDDAANFIHIYIYIVHKLE